MRLTQVLHARVPKAARVPVLGNASHRCRVAWERIAQVSAESAQEHCVELHLSTVHAVFVSMKIAGPIH